MYKGKFSEIRPHGVYFFTYSRATTLWLFVLDTL